MGSPRKSVLYASFDPVPSAKGASVRILNLFLAIKKEFPGSVLVTLRGRFYQREPSPFPHIFVTPPFSNFLQSAEFFGKEVGKIIQSGNWGAVHVRSIWEGVPSAYLKQERKFKLIYEANGFPSVELKYLFPKVGENIKLLQTLRDEESFCLEMADHIITQSETTKKFILQRGIPEEKITVIRNGADPPSVSSPLSPSLPFKLLYLGTLSPWQGIKTMLDAMALLRDEPVHLTVAASGKKPLKKHWFRRVRHLQLNEKVSFLEEIPYAHLPSFLAGYHCGLAPLRNDERNLIQGCSPIKIFDYLSAGLPVIASKLPVVEEILEDEREALLHPPGDPEALAEAIKRLLLDRTLYMRLSSSALASGKKNCWKKRQEQLISCYQKLFSTC